MAFCTRCKSEIDALAVECPKCGWDFGEDEAQPVQRGLGRAFAYTPVAEAALVIGQVAAGLGCAFVLAATLVALFSSNWLGAVQGAIMFFVLLALLVVFLPVQDIRAVAGPPRRLPKLTDRFSRPDEKAGPPFSEGIQPPAR